MKKLSEYKDDEAMDVLAEIIEPASHLIADKDFKIAIRGDKKNNVKPDRAKAVKIALKEHRQDIVSIMASLEQVPVEEFHYNLFTLPKMVLDIFNDKELIDFFTYQSEENSEMSSGSAMANTEENQSTSSNM
jgi:hypothetical protein